MVSNPNSPLGTIMSEEEMIELIRFCEFNSLPLIAVETLQNTVYPEVVDGKVVSTHSAQSSQVEASLTLRDIEGKEIPHSAEKKFRSFRYMVQKLDSPLELFSMFSISKGPYYKYIN